MQAAHNHCGTVSLLIEASAEIDMKTACGDTALMSAAACDSDGCLQLLLHAGADLQLQNGMGLTALRCAELKGRVSAQLLLQDACTPPASPSTTLAADAVLLKLSDGRHVHVPAWSLHRGACADDEPTSHRGTRSRRSLHRASGLLARELCS